MAVNRTRTIKNKHVANKSGIESSKAARRNTNDGVVKAKKPQPGRHVHASAVADLIKKKKKKRVFTEKELGIPQLNKITPVGVVKPKGKKKGKVFVDDSESMATILAIAQAEKEGQIESKMMKARQMEEIREARRVEAEKKEAERKESFENTKDALRKKRKRSTLKSDDADVNIKSMVSMGTKAAKPKKKKVAFAT